ncbi:MAG: prolyl oligopeptidase family serine peptidase, partial [Flavobacteriales bacterium]
VQLPGAGMASGFNGENGYNTAYFSFTSFIQPSMVFQIDLSSGAMQEYWKPQLPIRTDAYETRQVFYTSKDGTRIPMFITCKKGLKLDGNNPVYLYGYGGFNISVTPAFTPHIIPFLDKGGIYAVANIRGGGEYGKEWHEAGTKLKKQNVFDDFIAAAEYLIREKYTNNKRIAISGRSNGGLLVGACMTQRPDLFKVALPGVGVLDMLHYHQFTIGYAWATDYGRSDNKDEFKALIKYSPLHNVKKAEYPATLVVTADHDDRVVPAHSYKFISELQARQQGSNPVLIRIDVNAGHGAGKPTSKLIDEWVDIWAFTMFHLGVK